MPRYIASGIHEKKSAGKPVKGKGSAAASGSGSLTKYRFLVMQRFGDDLQKMLLQVNQTFDLKTTYTICRKVIDILEYIHSFGYIHADIKASNLLLGRSYAPTPKGKGLAEQNGIHSEVWLVDFGLVEKFRNSEGQHRSCEEDQRRANNGTVEFTSRDSHIGALCRRSDLEILGFNILSWMSGGRLPWMSNLKDHKFVYSCKKYFMDRLHDLFNYAFDKDAVLDPNIDFDAATSTSSSKKAVAFDKNKVTVKIPAGIAEYFQYIVKLDFMQDPDYDLLKAILSQAICKVKGSSFDDGRFFFTKIPAKTVAKITSKLKRSSLSSPEIGRRRTRHSDHEEEEVAEVSDTEEEEEVVEVKGRRGRKPAKVEKNGKVDTAAARSRVAKKAAVRRRSESPIKSPCLSAPTSHATPQKTPDAALLMSCGLDKPTPAMLEVLQRLKEKRKKGAGKSLFPESVFVAAKVDDKLKHEPAVKRPAIRVTAASKATNGTTITTSDSAPEEEEVSVKKKAKASSAKGRVTTAATRESGDTRKQLSSNSSTHSAKENKGQPTRRSPRVHL